MAETAARDKQALDLRMEGRSFAHIARIMAYDRASDANAAFNRALRRQPKAARARLRKQELARLDALTEKVRGSDENPEGQDRKLRTVERLRTLLMEEDGASA